LHSRYCSHAAHVVEVEAAHEARVIAIAKDHRHAVPQERLTDRNTMAEVLRSIIKRGQSRAIFAVSCKAIKTR
jgi:hypothetical protein